MASNYVNDFDLEHLVKLKNDLLWELRRQNQVIEKKEAWNNHCIKFRAMEKNHQNNLYALDPKEWQHSLVSTQSTKYVKIKSYDGAWKLENVPIHRLRAVGSIPKMQAWAPINENMMVQDQNQIINIPFIGDKERDRNFNFIEDYIYNHGIDYFEDVGYVNNTILIDLIKAVAHAYENGDLPNNPNQSEIPFADIFKEISKYQYYGTEETIRMKYLLATQCTKPQKNTYECYSELYCRRCCIYDCLLHRSEEDKISRKMSKSRINDLKLSSEPCKNECYKLSDSEKEARSEDGNDDVGSVRRQSTAILDGPSTSTSSIKSLFTITDEWTPSDQSLILSLCKVFPNNYCAIAQTMLTKTCKQVFKYCQENKLDVDSNLDPNADTQPPQPMIVSQTEWIAERKKVLYDSDFGRKSWIPCNHDGPCGKTCSCFEGRHFCEKFCNCSDECPLRYPGCRCSGPCDTTYCRCNKLDRECDPDCCNRCGADKFNVENIACKNVNLQRGQHKHLLIGPSDVVGWGAFLKGNAKRYEFICEYRGDVITQKEAERRGRLNDKLGCSYLFNLNHDYVIDAQNKGNKTRFINHSKKPNCYPRILMVNGDHRIGFFAFVPIKSGEELFFDYGDTFWKRIQEKPKMKSIRVPK
ncbi:histone-lysine N-methyltransferase E(z)-like [Contarinia nasturtii]|uniref:histone-lysine N-methyltransferase E(z)-like n=1 Tax=Contarinia nasturtii TaxID=265458 RepID=UPI0012D4004F|nr:histone-lysine N-methyltransferase E(z)-like [Contarinia nasturtii]